MRTATTKILVVEDAPEFRQLIEAVLKTEPGYDVSTCDDGLAAVELARAVEPDVIILDVGLPGMDGVAVCAQLRRFTDAYIIMLTARTDEVDRILGLSIGADDYMTKPFSTRELLARIQVLLRRPRSRLDVTGVDGLDSPNEVIEHGGIRLDRRARTLQVDDERVGLTKIEFDLLEAMMSRPGMVFTRRRLLDTVWGDDWYGDDHVVSVHIANIRRKLDRRDRSAIETVRGVGYRFEPPPVD